VLNPNSSQAWGRNGWNNIYAGNPETALANFERAIRLSPLSSSMFGLDAGVARAHFNAGRYIEAADWAERSLSARSDVMTAHRIRAAAYAQAGRLDDARRAIADMLVLEPDMRLSRVSLFRGPWRRPDDYDRWFEGLRVAGLPE
jgi:Flp pilus assembly protein TadD